MAPLKNTSIFQNCLQFHDDAGIEYRAEKKGAAIHVYIKRGDAFIHDAIVTGRFTPRGVLSALSRDGA